jgi:hypothetical protein
MIMRLPGLPSLSRGEKLDIASLNSAFLRRINTPKRAIKINGSCAVVALPIAFIERGAFGSATSFGVFIHADCS